MSVLEAFNSWTNEVLCHSSIHTHTPLPLKISHQLLGAPCVQLSFFNMDCQTTGKTCMVTFPCYCETIKGKGGKRAETMNQVLNKGRTRAKITFRSKPVQMCLSRRTWWARLIIHMLQLRVYRSTGILNPTVTLPSQWRRKPLTILL